MIKRVTQLVTEVESNLLKLVLMASHVDRFAGIQHDMDALRAEQEKQKEPSKGEGPQIHADKRDDIAASQDDDDATVTLCELQLAVRALEPQFTESEGGSCERRFPA